MEVKTAAWATVAVVIAAFGGIAIYTIDKETLSRDIGKANQQLAEKQQLQTNREDSLKEQRERLEKFREKTGQLDKLKEAAAKTAAGNKELEKAADELRTKWTGVRDAFARDIESVRQRVKDEKMASLLLADGGTLKHAQLTGVEGGVALFEHDAGMSKVPVANLPENLAGKLAPAWNPALPAELLPAPGAAEIAAAAKKKGPVGPSLEEVNAAAAKETEAEPVKSPNASKIREIEGKIAGLQRTQVAAARGRAEHMRIYAEYSAKYENARANGRSNSHNIKRDDARTKADNFTQQSLNCEVEIQRLQGELDRLR